MTMKQKPVNEVCREWTVREDNALAYQLQQLEVEKHYSGNKSRNAIVREDFVIAKDEQKRAQEEAFAIYQRQKEREDRDARIAREIAEKFENEEREKQLKLEEEDKKIAKKIQEKEKRRAQETGDVNSVGLPPPPPRPIRLQTGRRDDEYECLWPPPPPPDVKSSQEKMDEELAKRLQAEEESSTYLNRDRLLAIEVQDTELAKMLYQKEKAKAKKVREKAKLRKQMEEEALSVMPAPVPNIAMAIDPTYTSSSKMKPVRVSPVLVRPVDVLLDEEVLPYMPVQGQKRPQKKIKDKKP